MGYAQAASEGIPMARLTIHRVEFDAGAAKRYYKRGAVIRGERPILTDASSETGGKTRGADKD